MDNDEFDRHGSGTLFLKHPLLTGLSWDIPEHARHPPNYRQGWPPSIRTTQLSCEFRPEICPECIHQGCITSYLLVEATLYLGKGYQLITRLVQMLMKPGLGQPKPPHEFWPPQCPISIGPHTMEKPTLIQTRPKGGAQHPALLLLIMLEVPWVLWICRYVQCTWGWENPHPSACMGDWDRQDI